MKKIDSDCFSAIITIFYVLGAMMIIAFGMVCLGWGAVSMAVCAGIWLLLFSGICAAAIRKWGND